MSGALLYFLPVLSFFICFVVGKVQQRGMESYVPISLFVFKYFIYLFESLQREREYLSPADSLPYWPQQMGLSQLGARS